MTTTRVDGKDEIVLNAKRYKIDGPVQSRLRESEPQPFTIHMDDWRGGLGVEIQDDELAPNRFFWSTCNTLFKGHLILPRLAVTTGTAPALDPDVISFLAGSVYARWSTVIHKYNNGTDSWGSTVQTGLPSTTGDFINITVDRTTFLVHAYETGYDFSSDGAAWTSSTRDVKYLTFWDDRLWGIDLVGQLWFSYELGTETLAACLAIEGIANGEIVTDILTAPATDGETIIYVATNRGLWAYDVDNDRFVAISSLSVPAGLTNGTGSVFWRTSIYYPAGSEIYEYTPGETARLDEIGPGNDSHGLPDDQKGRIIKLVATHNELLALVDTTALSNNTGASFSILAYNIRHRSWRCLHEHGTSNITPVDMIADNSYGVYRLWVSYGTSGDIDRINLPYEVTNDLQTTDATYATGSELITFWTTVPDDVTAAAVRLRVNVNGTTANETVKIEFAINLSSSYTTLGTIGGASSDGVTTFDFPNSSTPTGTTFRHIRFRVTLARGGTNTLTPDMLSLELEGRTKKLPIWVHTVKVLFQEESPDGRQPRIQFADLRTVAESELMVEFTFRDGVAAFVYYVDVTSVDGFEETGPDFGGEMTLVLAES